MTSSYALVIGNRNYSSWSMRAWLAMQWSGVPFEEIFIPLDLPESRAALEQHSPSGLVPALKIDGALVWDSLAIIETLNELAPEAGMWPVDQRARQVARSVSAQMHSGFYRLRRDMPMDIRSDHSSHPQEDGALRDVAQVIALWTECRAEFGKDGNFLFGAWSGADMMFAPVVSRFRTYAPAAAAAAADYMEAVWDHPDVKDWVAKAEQEPYEIDVFCPPRN